MKKIDLNSHVEINGGWWKCALGIFAVVAGITLAATGVGTALAGGAVGGGLGLVNSRC
jgi:hypothetical protein